VSRRGWGASGPGLAVGVWPVTANESLAAYPEGSSSSRRLQEAADAIGLHHLTESLRTGAPPAAWASRVSGQHRVTMRYGRPASSRAASSAHSSRAIRRLSTTGNVTDLPDPFPLLMGFACPPGTFCEDSGETVPLPCPPGTYQNASAQAGCDQCPERHFCEDGTSDPVTCPEGRFCP